MNEKEINEQFGFSYARNAEHYQVHSDILSKVTAEIAAKYGFTALHTDYAGLYDVEDECYLRNKGFESTADVEAADKKQDNLFLYLMRGIENATLSPVEAEATVAKHLVFVVKPYANAHRLSYAQEMGAISDLVKKLQGEEQEAVEQLGLTQAVQALADANQAFNEVYSARSGESLTRSTSETMRTIRPKVDKAFKKMASAINALYKVNELVAKDAETREELGTLIDEVNKYLHQLQKTLSRAGLGSKPSYDSDDEEEEPTPEPVTPEITAVYQKEGGDPENPNRIERGEQTGVNYKGFTLKGQDGTLEHVIGLVNDQDYIEWINPETISNVTETSCEFTMVPDLTEGQYKVRIETYDGGSPLVVEYPEPITLW